MLTGAIACLLTGSLPTKFTIFVPDLLVWVCSRQHLEEMLNTRVDYFQPICCIYIAFRISTTQNNYHALNRLKMRRFSRWIILSRRETSIIGII